MNRNPETGPESRWTGDGAPDAEALLDALLAQSGVGITIVDRDLRILRANEAFGGSSRMRV